jgi:hypothetical protein
VKLFVCWGTFDHPGGHPCRIANEALRDAGHEPDLARCFGWKALPGVFNLTPGRREVKRLTGKLDVPVLVTGGGEVVEGTKRIVDWARANPAPAT